jgi:type IV pilus assembly protein PilM
MARTGAVWGIDIGQCALKALKCRVGDDPQHITAEAFDYIEYPKILSQPEANPTELIADALKQFLSRNTVRGDRVAISVSGQSGLARFIKLPPVESKKIPDIVKYEARQQIPFALDDVVWDYQRMAGGSEDEGYALETEVGLFAMKRDQVYRALKPLEDAGIEVDYIQLTPLAIYNYTVFDQMQDLPPADQYDPEDPPESVVVISLGTDTTDLVITNGYRVWQRSVAIGGNHFTKALTKELRLTFAKAEHLKRNASQADDPKAVFQAMRPVFGDLLSEIQRSIGYFTSLDRRAKIGRAVALGNAMKLPGLQKYLSQHLGYPVTEVDSYRGLSGGAVVSSPVFKENLLSFAVSYGLALQGLNKGKLATNLLPREIVTDRMIRDKKPWAVATAAIVLLGCTINYFGHWQAWASANPTRFQQVTTQADAVKSKSSSLNTDYATAFDTYTKVDQTGQNIMGNQEGRLRWLELVKAVTSSLPHDEGERPDEIMDRRELHITEVECENFPDLAVWFQGVQQIYNELKAGRADASTTSATAPPADAAPMAVPAPPPTANGGEAPAPAPTPDGAATPAPGTTPSAAGGLSGEGWVIQLRGYHYFNKNKEGAGFVRDTLIKNLEEGTVMLAGPDGREQEVKISKLGVSHPLLVETERIRPEEIDDPNAPPPAAPPVRAVGGVAQRNQAVDQRPKKTVQRFDFVLQFAWKPTTFEQRAAADKPVSATPSTAPAGEAPGQGE